ncbi:hypothetical protein ACP26L_28920 [Paenibacillus sp. S-38]|uniref:hypothetical protein n=1 Tax=Paenibacillus sp. S-38 TaxID=3416710 RepID=UPI003CE7BC83
MSMRPRREWGQQPIGGGAGAAGAAPAAALVCGGAWLHAGSGRRARLQTDTDP